jgi:beta-N-acetylhexosaminidase
MRAALSYVRNVVRSFTPKRLFVGVLLSVFLVSQSSPAILYAVESQCVEGVSAADCSAITGTWTQWIEDDGTCAPSAAPQAATGNVLAQRMFVGVNNSALAKEILAKYDIGGLFLISQGSPARVSAELKGELKNIQNTAKSPLFIATDQEYTSTVNSFGLADGKKATDLAGMTDTDAQKAGESFGTALAAAGVNMDFAPVVDLHDPENDVIGSKFRAISSNPAEVVSKAKAFSTGLASKKVMPVIKHWPGHGTSDGDSHVVLPTTPDIAAMEKADLVPFNLLANQTPMAVMIGHLNVPGLTNGVPASASSDAYNYLRTTTKFRGLTITDELGGMVGAGSDPLPARVSKALTAGADMALFNVTDLATFESVYTAAEAAVKTGSSANVQTAKSSIGLTATTGDVSLNPNVNATSAGGSAATLCCGTTNSTVSTGPITSLTGTTPQEKVYNYFISRTFEDGRKMTSDQAFGFMGNIQQESGFQVDNQQNGKAWPTAGWGLIQWTGPRRTAIVAAMQAAGIGDLYSEAYADGKTPPDRHDQLMLFQLDYVFTELDTTHKGARDALLAATTLKEASTAILGRFEIPRNWQSEIEKRAAMGEALKAQINSGEVPPITGGTPNAVAASASTKKTVIALDPGHGGLVKEYIDQETGLADRETTNSPEREDVTQVAQRVKAELELAGYTVILLRGAAEEAVNKRMRVDKALDKANNGANKADLAVSIHTGPGQIDEVWPQRVGTYREYGTARLEIKPENEAVAKKSQEYADKIAKAREAAEGHPIGLDPDNSFQAGIFGAGRDDVPTKGNVSLVQLWGQTIPWVYNEISQNDGKNGLTDDMKTKYVDGLIAGIKAAVPAGSGAVNASCSSGGSGGTGLAAKTLEYAWPDYRGRNYTTNKPEWAAVVANAPTSGRYVGGTRFPGVDCGGFVTNLLIDSGFDTKYNHSGLKSEGASWTPTQYAWLTDPANGWNEVSITDPSQLQPGDVAITRINPGHTFIWVGDVAQSVPGAVFGSKIASASMDDRAPMADTSQDPLEARFAWFRKGPPVTQI